MQRIKVILLNLCLIIFFAQAAYSLLLESKESYLLFKKYSALNDDHKRYDLIGERYRFALKCGNIIPINASILYLSNPSNNQESFDLFLNYHLYPRKLYWLDTVAPYSESPPALEDLNQIFLSERNITWIIFNYPKEYGGMKAVNMGNGRVVKLFNLD
jgi:hypothetical protein